MQINDGFSSSPVRPSPPRIEPRPTPRAPAPDAHVSAPPTQHLFSPPRVPPTSPSAPPPVPTTVADARQRVYDETLHAATPPVINHLPPASRAAALNEAAGQAEQAVAVFNQLYQVTDPAATPAGQHALGYMPVEHVQELRQQAVGQAWQAYGVLTVDGPLLTPRSSSAVVQRAVDQTGALVQQGSNFSSGLQGTVVDQIVAGTDGLETRIADETGRALGNHFPTLRDFYGEQGRRFTEMLRDGIRTTAQAALAPAPAPSAQTAPADALAPLRRLQGRYEAMRTDVAVVSGFDGADPALDAYGITLGRDGTGAEWTDAQREHVVAQAVRIENAFRAADPDGLLARFGPGEAFDAMFASRGDITLNTIPERRGCNWPTAPVISAGAMTCSSNLIEYRTFSSEDLWDGVANSLQYHFSHEFGHALNASLSGAYNGLDRKDRTPYQTIDDAAEGLPNPSQRDWDDPAWGLPWREADGAHRRFPYQQNVTASNGEYFADTFANWANGTLLDNDAGRALDSWMGRMAPEWVRTRLEASGLLVPPPAATTTPSS